MSQGPTALSSPRADWLAPMSVKVAMATFVVNEVRLFYNCLNFGLD